MASPMPSTSSSSSTAVKPPLLVRHAMIASAVTGPDAGQRLERGLVGGVEVDQRPPRPGGASERCRPRPRHRRDADQDLLAVDDRPGEVERGQVDPAPRSAGRLERVDDPRARRAARRCRGGVPCRRRRPTSSPPDRSPRTSPSAAALTGASRRATGGRTPPEPPAPPPAWSRTAHQAASPTASAATTATTARWTGPELERHRSAAAATRAAPAPAAPRRRRADSPARPRGSRTRVWRGVRRGSPRTAASSALSVASRRDTASACSEDDWGRRMPSTLGTSWPLPTGASAQSVERGQAVLSREAAGPRRPRPCRARRGRRAPRRARRT